jgi:hypothetical protein
VHKKLRSKRLAPVLIKEVTRQCHLKGIFQAIYTAGIVIPTPISTCRYYHRTLNIPKLVDVKFTYVPRDMTIARMIRQAKVPSTPTLARSGLREMEERDVSAVSELIRGTWSASTRSRCSRRIYGTSFSVSAALERVASTGRRQSQVVWTYFDEVRSSTLLSRLLLLNIAALVALRKFGHKEISYCSAAGSPFMGCAARSIVATASFVATASLNACLRHSTLATVLGARHQALTAVPC